MPYNVHSNKRKDLVPFPSPSRHFSRTYPFAPLCPIRFALQETSFSPTRRSIPLVVLRRGLTSLELLKVPVADRHVAVVLIHALGEVLRGALAVVLSLPVVGGLLVLRDGGGVGLGRGSSLRGAAAEEAADGVTDGGADCYTSASC